MDTDNLALMTHEILSLAEQIDRAVMLDIACLCEEFSDENTYLKEVLDYLQALRERPGEYIAHWNLEENLHPERLKASIIELEGYVKKVLDTPLKKRGITYEVHEYEMPRGDYITDLSHFLDGDGEIAKAMPKEAREKASFFTLLVDAATSVDDYELKTGIRCFKPACEGKIFVRMPEDSGIEWHCLMCGVSGIINNWQGSKWDNSTL